MKRWIFAAFWLTVMASGAQKAPRYVNPTGDRIPILAWYSILPEEEITPERFQELADAGFNISFSHFSTQKQAEKALKVCRKTGVKLILGGVEEDTKARVSRFKNDKSVAGWFLRDEPSTESFAKLREFRNRILEADTSHLLYLNLLPNYAPLDMLHAASYKEYVDRFVDEVDLGFISFDFYPVNLHPDSIGINPGFYQNLEDVRQVSLRSGQPFWGFSLATAHGPYSLQTREMMRLQMFSNLAYGAQGLQYFTYWTPGRHQWDFHNAPIALNGKRTNVYYLVKDLNREIQNLAWVFLGARVLDVSHTGTTIPQGTKPLGPLPAPFKALKWNGQGLLVSHLQNKGRNFLLIVNRDVNHSQLVTVDKDAKVQLVVSTGDVVDDEERNNEPVLVAPGDYLLYVW